ncbi:helix-turn-helix transcriptional regulator [Oribacterium sinus]|uniref:helix-turn-helix transcriptional regulator n=1 Tax=Oribacterium sinus TaxID=237576 RepID=UPI0028F0564E|nr:helix-turn-helix transcriptional regulator [Oribacterium sinus]
MKDRLKKLRKTLNLTQQKFADKLGVKQNTIAQYEMGRNDPSDAVIISICREFGVSEEWIRTGKGDMFIPMTRDEEIATFIGSIQADVDDTFKKRLISVLAKLDEKEWDLLEKIAEDIVNSKN